MAGNFRDLTGQTFGLLTVVSQTASKITTNGSRAQWVCSCACGKETVRDTIQLTHRKSPNCGCQHHAWVKHHGHSYDAAGKRSPTYRSWQNMVARCTNPTAPNFAHYAKRNITLCDRWRTFTHFLEDMGEAPPRGTIERRDNDKGYEPGNCCWATRRQQANNRSTNIYFEYKGVSYTLANLARSTGQSKETLRARLVRPGGWSVTDAVETPTIPRHLRRAGLSKR